jgi:ubiquinone/menaquinone biosynthesis C-methylase UbiE
MAVVKPSVAPHPYREFEHVGWECAANAYAATFESATRLYAEVLLDAAGLKAGDSHLDVACGTGYVTELARERGAGSIGADFSAAMLTEAVRLHPLARFEQADAEALPYSDDSFDVVTINFGVHHFPFPERALAEAHRVLRTAGRVSFTVWATPDEHALHAMALEAVRGSGSAGAGLPAPPHGVLNTLAGCIKLLEAAHFKPVAQHCTLVRRSLTLGSVAELTHLMESGTVRLASLLRSQPQANRVAVLRGLERAAAKYQRDGHLEIPIVAVVATGTADAVR